MGLAKLAFQWLIEHLSFVPSAVLADSFVLRIRHFRQAPKSLLANAKKTPYHDNRQSNKD